MGISGNPRRSHTELELELNQDQARPDPNSGYLGMLPSSCHAMPRYTLHATRYMSVLVLVLAAFSGAVSGLLADFLIWTERVVYHHSRAPDPMTS